MDCEGVTGKRGEEPTDASFRLSRSVEQPIAVSGRKRLSAPPADRSGSARCVRDQKAADCAKFGLDTLGIFLAHANHEFASCRTVFQLRVGEPI